MSTFVVYTHLCHFMGLDSRALVDPSGGVGDPASQSMPSLAKCAKFGLA